MYTAAQFIEQLVAEFPELREDIEDESGLLHNQMHAFTRLTNDAIRAGDYQAVRRHFVFVDRFFHHSVDELENGWYVSYLEGLKFVGPTAQKAESLMSPALREGRRDILAYLDELLNAREAKPHDSRNA
jgi:hypothetical protein